MFLAAHGPSIINYYSIYDYGAYSGFSNTSGRTSVSTALVGGETTLIFIVAGQSIAANHNATPYTPTHTTKSQNFNVYNGSLYQLVDPVLGASGTDGSYQRQLCDRLIDAGKGTRIIMIPVAIGATSSLEWTSAGVRQHRLLAAYRWARSLGWSVSAVLWDQGQSDLGVSSATYQAQVKLIQAELAGIGYSGPWFIAVDTMNANVVNATIQGAQAALVDHSANRWAGPNIDSLTGVGNRSDGTHLTAAGCDSAAALWVTALGQLF